MSDIVKVDFYGDELECVQEGQTIWVSVRRMCEALGIAFDAQRVKLKGKTWARDTIIVSHDVSGRKQEQFFVDLDTVPMWLATIDENRVAFDIRPRLQLYQKECKRVLRDHFFGVFRPPETKLEAAKLWVAAMEEAEREKQGRLLAEAKIEEDRPKVQFAEDFKVSEDAITLAKVSKAFSAVKGLHIGENRLFRYLRKIGHFRTKGDTWNLPIQRFIESGLYEVKTTPYEKPNGKKCLSRKTMVTAKGQMVIWKKLLGDFGRVKISKKMIDDLVV